jgi:hypothetical protein
MSRFVLAGDWIDTGLPATIEGAVMSGHAAAAARETVMNSIVVHYTELALKGRTARGSWESSCATCAAR